jgi:HptB-dependent secretion and biofilm anti anti-sigma factor
VAELSNGVSARFLEDGETLEIRVEGILGIGVYREFRAAYADQMKRVERYQINLRECKHIDSSGLGVLLILRDYTGFDRERLAITECSPTVRQLLSYAGFEQLFSISSAQVPGESGNSVLQDAANAPK